MAILSDTDPTSNNYFFLTGYSDTFNAGKNSFIVNCSNKIIIGQELDVRVYDSNGNSLPVNQVEATGPTGIEVAKFNEIYIVTVPKNTEIGIGRIEIGARGVDSGIYTGQIAFYSGKAYPVAKNTRLPLIAAPNSAPFPIEDIVWTRNILIDTSVNTESEVRFFDIPYLEVTPEIFSVPEFPQATYNMASGVCSGIAIVPKNNDSGDYDYQNDKPLYQLFYSSGDKFKFTMEGEKIRIINPYIKSFIFANYSNNQINFEGRLQTDFIATIDRVVNDGTIILNIPFTTVADLVDRVNEDSPYNKNNLVNIHGYTVNDDASKQTVYHKRNTYVLSISDANYEIIYKNIGVSLVSSSKKRSIINIEFNNLRSYCGNLSSYKIYGKSLNTPSTKTLIADGRVEPDELIVSNNFNNSVYNKAGDFYNQTHTDRFWLINGGGITLNQSDSVFIDGAKIGHVGNNDQSQYVIFKDDTSGVRSSLYVSYNLASNSYWYGKSDAFLNSAAIPAASYSQISNIPTLSGYTTSQENLLSGAVHDSNPIRLRKSTLHQFSVYVRPDSGNTSDSTLYVYFLSGTNKKLIGTIDSNFKFGSNQKYSNTFFSEIEQYGTIILVPVLGTWNISSVSLVPYMSLDYSIDSFAVKIPLDAKIANELYEIEAELYDGKNKLAYGEDSYTFVYNKTFLPLKKQIFLDPSGVTLIVGGSGTSGTSGANGSSGTSGANGSSGVGDVDGGFYSGT